MPQGMPQRAHVCILLLMALGPCVLICSTSSASSSSSLHQPLAAPAPAHAATSTSLPLHDRVSASTASRLQPTAEGEEDEKTVAVLSADTAPVAQKLKAVWRTRSLSPWLEAAQPSSTRCLTTSDGEIQPAYGGGNSSGGSEGAPHLHTCTHALPRYMHHECSNMFPSGTFPTLHAPLD
jgi:hypothetical protein